MLISSGIFIILGVLCIIGSRIWRFQTQNVEKYKGRAAGTVAEIVSGAPDQAGLAAGIHDYYYPVIAFYANGRFYKLRYHKGSNPCRYKLNEKLDIRYDKMQPENFEIREDHRMAALLELLYILGLVCCCIGGIFFLLFATRY